MSILNIDISSKHCGCWSWLCGYYKCLSLATFIQYIHYKLSLCLPKAWIGPFIRIMVTGRHWLVQLLNYILLINKGIGDIQQANIEFYTLNTNLGVKCRKGPQCLSTILWGFWVHIGAMLYFILSCIILWAFIKLLKMVLWLTLAVLFSLDRWPWGRSWWYGLWWGQQPVGSSLGVRVPGGVWVGGWEPPHQDQVALCQSQ